MIVGAARACVVVAEPDEFDPLGVTIRMMPPHNEVANFDSYASLE